MTCQICPRGCNADRTVKTGVCGEKNEMRIARYALHPYEEPIISGTNGSGTIFFSGCSLCCVFCQNYEVSRGKTGKPVSPRELADIFKALEDQGAHNVNLVNPTHFYPQILRALDLYRPSVPVVVNTHGYERVETLRQIDDYVDVYLPDLKYFSPELSMRYSRAKNYFDVASKAIAFMAQKPLVVENGLIKSGTVVRHLTLPLATSDTFRLIDWFANTIGDRAYFSLMAQYTPFGEIQDFPELQRKITRREYQRVQEYLQSKNLTHCFLQQRSSASETYIPTWDF